MDYTKQEKQLRQVVKPLLGWYDENLRVLPWRENTHPYLVWVSEIMLQQTRVEAVKPYYDRFIKQLPTIESLAQAEEEALLKLWEGLGYYNRVRNLQKAAQLIMAQYGGVFPDRFEDILKLPGIGTYTAGAITSICFEKPVPAVDGNVLRVLARLSENPKDIASATAKSEATEALRQIYPVDRCGDFTQSLMELGALVCTPTGQPKCAVCPLGFLCCAYHNKTQACFPVKSKSKPRRKEEKTVFLLLCGDQVAVQKRTIEGLLGGLWEFPNTQGKLSVQQAQNMLRQWGIDSMSVAEAPPKKHIFTHIEWLMSCYVVTCKQTGGEFLWVNQGVLQDKIMMPTAFKQFLALLYR